MQSDGILKDDICLQDKQIWRLEEECKVDKIYTHHDVNELDLAYSINK